MKNYILIFSFLIFCQACKKSSGPDSAPTAAISNLNCLSAAASSGLTGGTMFNGTITVPYSGGNGVAYSAGPAITSTGVLGLTAVQQGGTLANGNGNFTYTLTGTPSSEGTASFVISFGGTSCEVKIIVNEAPLVQYGTPFPAVPARQDATIYQVNMRAFSSTSNFQGVIARLDSIKALGINVIYLMPIFPVGSVNSVNSPYCVKDYKLLIRVWNINRFTGFLLTVHSKCGRVTGLGS
jgi:hypothetical protein